MNKLDINEKYQVSYCVPLWRRDEQIRHSTRRIKKRLECYPEGQKRVEPVAIVCFGPSLNDTWEKIREFKYVISCSGAHKFLVDRGITPTWHVEVDPRAHKVELIGKPQKTVQYLIASACHPKLFDHLEGFDVSLWHVFSNGEEAQRMLPAGEWAVKGGSSAGLRSLTIARFLGFIDLHIFGMDGCDGKSGKHAASHPNQSKLSLPLTYDGVTYHTTPNFLECAKETPHELDTLPGVKATFYGDGLVQHLMRNHKPNPTKGEVVLAISKPFLISPEYRELNERLHKENPEYGVHGGRHAALVLKLFQTIRARSILDYGAGKGYMAKELPFPIWEYDPAVPGKDESPRPAELLVSTDVLEHIEPDRLPFVLDDMRQRMRRIGYFVIHLGPSKKHYADGRNTHLIQKDAAWWRETLGKFFAVGKTFVAEDGLHAIVGVQHHVLTPGQVPILMTVDDDGLRDASTVLEEVERLSKKASSSVSIVIPTYNHLDLLKACLDSVSLYTDLTSCEVIVMANGCTDGTVDYLKTLPPPFRYLVNDKPVGFTAAANAGIREARGKYVCLLNNDTVLLPQMKNSWIDTLLAPFQKDAKIGITGPVKFSWDCGGTQRRAVAFWCAMIPKKLFDEIGLLDESFSPGMGEDGDFSIKAEQAGYLLVQVPVDGAEEFGKGVPIQQFPIYHKGSGTFGDKDYSEVSKRNTKILEQRYGKKDDLEAIYNMCLVHKCDTNELFPTLRSYADKCDHLTEFGVRGVFTTWAFLARRPKRMVSYDIEYNPNIEGAKKEAAKAGVSFEFRQENTLEATIEPTDLLFIDTTHTFIHLKTELERHAGKVSRYILIHDVESFGDKGADGGPGEKQAIAEFLAAHPEWNVREHITISNGLTVLERKTVAVSIVIPTCGKDWEVVLKRCLEAVLQFTDLSDKEIIVIPNGSPKEAVEYLKTKPVKIVEFPEPIGYIRAVNAGIAAAQGDKVVLLDDDSFLIAQEKDGWIRTLIEPFEKDPKMGAAGPFGQTYDDLGQVLHSGCTMYKTSVLREIGLFDEAFNPGYMGDEDAAIRIRKAGYNLQEVPKGGRKEYVNGVFEIQFPVIHTGSIATMPKHTTDLPLVAKNRKLLYERHTKPSPLAHPRVSIVIPTLNHLEDLLKPNLKSLTEYTNLDDVEVIVVANGCTDGTEDYVKTLGSKFRLLSFPDAIGYTRATNEGIKISTGDFIVLYNNDNVLLSQPKNRWVNQLLEPFRDNPKMGITGPLQLHDDYADADVIIGFCLCISRPALEEAGGLLDEIYSPGGGEDIDLCCKVRAKGFVVRQVPVDGKQGMSHQNTGDFQIWHKNNQTFKDIPDYTRFIVKKNGLVNLKRYNQNIRLNIGSGGIEHRGYLSVDLHDQRANIIMDVTQLDFPENSVSEILAIHVFEHLNPYHCLDILKRWRKILKPGGKLIMEMPDVEALCKRFVTANTGERYGILNAVYGSVNTTGEGGPDKITSPHLFGWWPQSLWDHLTNAGFVNIVFGPEIFHHPESNLHVSAEKPHE